MEREAKKVFSAHNLAFFAVLTALVIALQLFASGIKIGTVTLNFSLLPIVLGAIILGPVYGGALGVISGLIVFFAGLTGADGFTFILIADHPVLTFLLCILKTGLAGVVSGLVYMALCKKHRFVALTAASGVVPVVNTGLFIVGALMMSGTLKANFVQDGESVMYFLVVICAGFNFLLEFIINVVLAPALKQVVRIVSNGKY